MKRLLQWALLGLFFAVPALRILKLRVDFEPSSLDGKFQTFGAVQLLLSDAVPYRDFPLYLGAGVTHAVLAMSVMFGNDVVSIQQAAITLNSLTFAAVLVLGMMAVGLKRDAWPATMALVALLFSVPSVVQQIDFSSPGASLVGVRAAAIALAGAAVWWLEARLRGRARYEAGLRGFCWGLLGGLLLLWSNDFGVAAAIALVMAACLVAWRSKPLWIAPAATLALYPLGLGLSLFLVLAMMGVSVGDWFLGNFVSTAGDQWWLFEPWDEATRSFSLGDVVAAALGFRSFEVQPSASSAIMLGAILNGVFLLRLIVSPHRPSPAFAGLGVAVLTAWGGGLIPTLAGHYSTHYWGPFLVMAAFSTLALPRFAWGSTPVVPTCVSQRVRPVWSWLFPLAGHTASGRSGVAVSVVAVGLAALTALSLEAAIMRTRVGEWATMLIAPSFVSRDVGGRVVGLSADQARDTEVLVELGRILDTCQVSPRDRVVESYPSLVSTLMGGELRPESFSVIHILGEGARERYLGSIRQHPPVMFASIAPDYSHYADWLLRARGFWYAPIMADYRPVARTDQHVLWLRDGRANRAASPGRCVLDRRSSSRTRLILERPPGSGEMGTATITYRSETLGTGPLAPLRTLVTVAEPRLGETDLTYGLPSTSIDETLTLLSPGPQTELVINALPEKRARLEVVACRAEYIFLPEMEALPRLGTSRGVVEAVRTAACAGPQTRGRP